MAKDPRHEHGHSHTTIVKERDGASGLLAGVIAIVLVVFLTWALFLSGWVFDRGGTEPDVNETNIEAERGAGRRRANPRHRRNAGAHPGPTRSP